MNSVCTHRLLCLALAACLAAPARAAEDGVPPVAVWTFESLANQAVPDVSGNGHTARLGSLPDRSLPTLHAGMVGSALHLAAAEGHEARVADSPALNPGTGLTAAAWIRHRGRRR